MKYSNEKWKSWRKNSVVVLKKTQKFKWQICPGEIHQLFLSFFFPGWGLRTKTEWATFFKDLSPRCRVYFHFCVFIAEKDCFEMEMHQLQLRYWRFSASYVRKRARIRDSVVVYLSSIKNIYWVTDTLRWNCNANFICGVQKHLGFSITFI